MSKRFFEGAQHAARYALTRPTYPPELIKRIISYLDIKYKGVHDLAVDVGCGSGQSTQLLSTYFKQVYGYDVSENQIKQARAKNRLSNVEYKVSSDSSIPHENQSICLITAAQAAHWFDLKQFYAEAQRTLKPQGVLAVYGYGVPSVKDSVEVDRVIQNFYQKLLPYFPPDREQIDNKYAKIELPFDDKLRDESIDIKYEWDVDRFLAYISTWSGYLNYMSKYPKKDILLDFRRDLVESMQTDKDLLKISFNTFLLLGRKNK